MPFRVPSSPASLLLAVSTVASACSDDVPGNATAGVPEVPAVEELRVGSLDDPVYSFSAANDLVVDDEGRIHTLHRQEDLVRIFEPDGTLAGSYGGNGDGPGEFRNPGVMGILGDSIWVLDYDGYVFSFFDPDGDLRSSFRVPFAFRASPDEESPPRAQGLLPDGRIHGEPPAWSSEVAEGTTTHRTWLLLTPEGETGDTLLRIEIGNSEWAFYDEDDPGAGGLYTRQPWADGPIAGFSPRDGSLYILRRPAPGAPGVGTATLTRRSLGGDTLFHRELDFETIPLEASTVDSLLDTRSREYAEFGVLGGAPAGRLRDMGARTLYAPAYLPPVTEMVPARSGGAWLGGQPREGRRPWIFVDAEGETMRSTNLPEGVRVLAGDADHLWGTTSDDLDVPYVVRYRVGGDG